MKLLNIFKKERSDKVVRAFYKMFGNLNLFGVTKRALIENGYNYNPDVYSVISFITQKASSLPFVYKDSRGEIVEGSEIEKKLSPPNQFLSFQNFIEQAAGYLLITGDIYIYAPRLTAGNNKGRLIPNIDIEIMPSHMVDIMFNRDGTIEYYQIGTVKFEKEEIIHINYFNPLSELPGETGLSPIQAGRLAVARNNKNYEASSKMFDNLGAIGFLTGKGETVEKMGMSSTQRKELKKELKRQMSGSDNAGEIVVTNHEVSWQQLGISAADLKLIEDRKMGIREICNIYHVPSALFGDSDANQYASTNEARKIAWTDAIMPLVEKIINRLNSEFIEAYGVKLHADYSEVHELQADKAKMVEWLSKAWWIKGNRKQEIMGEKADPELDDYFIPAGVMPLSIDTGEPTDEEINQELGGDVL